MKTQFVIEDPKSGNRMNLSRFLCLFEWKGFDPLEIDADRTQVMGLECGGCYVKFFAGERSLVIKIEKEEFECLFRTTALQ